MTHAHHALARIPRPARKWTAITAIGLALLAAGTLRAETYDIPRLDGIVIDGDDHEWAGRGLHVALMDRMQRSSVNPTVSGEADLRVGWDARGVLLRLQVIDAQHLEDEVLWRLDAVELFLFAQPGSPVGCQAVITPGLDEKFNQLRWKFYTDSRPKGSPTATLEAARQPTADGYLMEVLLPWSDIGIAPVVGNAFGMQLIVDDADRSRERADTEFICWLPDRNTVANAAAHRLRLADRPSPETLSRFTMSPAEAGEYPLAVETLPQLAGSTLTAVQGGRELASAVLAAVPARGLSQAGMRLRGCAVDGPPVDLRVGDRQVGSIGFYRALPAALAADFAQALRAADDQERFRLIGTLLGAKELVDPLLRADLEVLRQAVDGWANNRAAALAGRLPEPDDYLDAVCSPGIPGPIRRDSPVYPMYCLYRARNLIWWNLENGMGSDFEAAYYAEARRLLAEAQRQVPDNPLIGMYLGQPVPWPAPFAPHPAAPAWANEQREGIEKLSELIHWWIDERQLPDGAFGGGLGDDCEMWRMWAPVLIGFDDPVVAAAQRRLSEGMFSSPHMAGGYTSETTDVEHTSEDSADTITPMLHLAPDDARWQARARRLAELMAGTWSGIDARGHRQFKSVVFNAQKVSAKPADACDTIYHPRVVQPALLLWQRTHDPALTAIFTPWLDGWVDATARAEHGKPAGIVPSAIHWPDGTVGGTSPDWWRPGAFRDSQLYAWPSSLPILLNTLLLAYHVTGEEKYLAPIRSMAGIRAAFQAAHPGEDVDERRPVGSLFIEPDPPSRVQPAGAPAGSADWCAARLGGPLNAGGTLAKYRVLTGDTGFDGMLVRDASSYGRYLLAGDEQALTRDLRAAADAFRSNRAAFTSEVRFTDRVFRLPQIYLGRFVTPAPAVPDSAILYGTLTGDPGDPLYLPLNAVRWLTRPQAIAALVQRSSVAGFTAQLYHFGDQPRAMGAELFLLRPGTYAVTLRTTEGGAQLASQQLTVAGPGARVDFTLPPRTLCTLSIR